MNWRKLYPWVDAFSKYPSYILVCITTASATIGVLYLKDPFEQVFQYLPALAGLLYFVGRLSFMAYYRMTANLNEFIAYLFFLSTGAALVGQYALGMDATDQDNISSFSYTLAVWVFNISYFFAGAACSRVSYSKSNIVAVVMVALVVVPLLFALEGSLFLDYYKMRVATGNDNMSHLYISEWCVFFFVGAYAFARPPLRPVIILIAFVCLFSLQGRSSTLFTFVTFIIYGFLTQGRKTIYSLVGVGILIVLAYVFLPVKDVFLEAGKGQMDSMLFSGEEKDTSLDARGDIFWFSLSHLPKSILFGDPTFIALEARRMGSYIHNLLSMWQFFGLLPFLLMVAMLYRGLKQMMVRIREGNLSVMEEIASMLLIYATISVIAAKSVSFYWLWFAAGYWMLRYSKKTHAGRRRSKRRRRGSGGRSRRENSVTYFK